MDTTEILINIIHSLDSTIDKMNDIKNDSKSTYEQEFCKGRIVQCERTIELINNYIKDVTNG